MEPCIPVVQHPKTLCRRQQIRGDSERPPERLRMPGARCHVISARGGLRRRAYVRPRDCVKDVPGRRPHRDGVGVFRNFNPRPPVPQPNCRVRIRRRAYVCPWACVRETASWRPRRDGGSSGDLYSAAPISAAAFYFRGDSNLKERMKQDGHV